MLLDKGGIIEMKTGEGKTLTATMAVYKNALQGKGVHVVTVNDYLSRRDAVWMGQIYNMLGVSVGCINHEQAFLYDPDYKKPTEEKDDIRDTLGSFKIVEDYLKPVLRKEAYQADITYGTNNEFGFDYLRDNMVRNIDDRVQGPRYFAIVDEADSILIDEARTPLIISTSAQASNDMYTQFSNLVNQLQPEKHYTVDEKANAVSLTDEGMDQVEKLLKVDNVYENAQFAYHLDNALKAKEAL